MIDMHMQLTPTTDIYLENWTDIKKNIDKKLFSLQFLPNRMFDLSKTKKFTYKGHVLKTEYLIDIVHNLILKYYFKKENRFKTYSLILREKYGKLYNYYMLYLLENGIIHMIKNYEKGVNARIYKLEPEILKEKIHRYKNTDKILLKKYKSALLSINEFNIDRNLINHEIKIKLVDDLFKIDIDFERADLYLKTTDVDPEVYNKNLYSIESIRDKHIFYHFDGYGRMHTNYTILKSFIRKNCLSIDGEQTYECDISNSQPLFLTKIIEETYKDIVDHKEYELFKYLTINGLFYQYILDNSGIKDKKKVKEMIYKVLFGKNNNTKYDKLFEKIFPSIYSFIKIFKKKMGDYRSLSHHLQKYESGFVFNIFIKELTDTYPDIKVITIHDSVVVPLSYKEATKLIFNDKLKEYFHFSNDLINW